MGLLVRVCVLGIYGEYLELILCTYGALELKADQAQKCQKARRLLRFNFGMSHLWSWFDFWLRVFLKLILGMGRGFEISD